MFNADPKVIQRMVPHLQRVLIVDPQPASVKLLQDLLRSLVNCQIWAAPTDARAIQAARAFDPQIIFLEHSGPELDGARLARALRRSDLPCRKAPILMVTGEATAQAILGARDSGVHEFLRKPYTIKDLTRRLEAVTLKPRDWVEAVHYVGPDRRRFNSGEYAGPRKRKSDARKSPDQARILQALKIVRAARQAVDSDWAQARRSLLAQAADLQQAAVAVGDLNLMEAAVELNRAGAAEIVDLAKLDKAIARVLTFMPPEEAESKAA
ncbi:MAG: response regulator [Caulobacter sp.]